jgi:hypothetical protein
MIATGASIAAAIVRAAPPGSFGPSVAAWL